MPKVIMQQQVLTPPRASTTPSRTGCTLSLTFSAPARAATAAFLALSLAFLICSAPSLLSLGFDEGREEEGLSDREGEREEDGRSRGVVSASRSPSEGMMVECKRYEM
jgi:hypothetical protein